MRRNPEYFPIRREPERGLMPRGFGEWMTPTSIFGESPWRMMRRMQEEMDRLFSQFFGPETMLAPAMAEPAVQAWTPRVDISETDREWLVEAELPGVRKEDIEVEVQDHQLVLRAQMREEREERPEAERARQYITRERRYGTFYRSMTLPETVDEENIRCEFRNGVLTIHLPKTEAARPQARRIPVSAAEERTEAMPSETTAEGTRSEQEMRMTQGAGPGGTAGAAGAMEEEEEQAPAGAKGGETTSP